MTTKLARPCIWLVHMRGWVSVTLDVISRKQILVTFVLWLRQKVCECDMMHLYGFIRHGMSYPISGCVKTFTAEGYDSKKPLIVSEEDIVVSKHILIAAYFTLSLRKASRTISGDHCSSCVCIHQSTLSRKTSSSSSNTRYSD